MGTDGGYQCCFFDPAVLAFGLIWSVGMGLPTVIELQWMFSDTKGECGSMIDDEIEPEGWPLIQLWNDNAVCSYTKGQCDSMKDNESRPEGWSLIQWRRENGLYCFTIIQCNSMINDGSGYNIRGCRWFAGGTEGKSRSGRGETSPCWWRALTKSVREWTAWWQIGWHYRRGKDCLWLLETNSRESRGRVVEDVRESFGGLQFGYLQSS